MKRLLTAVTLLVGFIFNTNAQTTDCPSQLNVSNDRFFINGMPLNDGEILDLLGEDIYNNEYLPAKKKLKTANTLGYVGSTIMGLGIGCAAGDLVSSALYGYEIKAQPYIIYGCITVVGLIPTLIHFQMAKNGQAAYMRIAETYNKTTGKVTELTLSPARTGFGLAINF